MGYFSFLKQYVQLHIRTALEYKTNFVFQSLFMFLNNALFLFFWYFIFEQIDTLRGWSFTDVVVLFAIGAFGFGLLSFFLGNWMRLTRIVEEGQLDFYLALPKDELLHVLVAKSDFYGFGDILFGLVIALVFLNPLLLPLVILFSILGGLVWGSLIVITSCLSFVLGKAQGPNEVMSSLIFALTTYPYTVFPPLAQIIFFVAIPVFFIANVPVMLLSSMVWWLLLAFVIVTAVFVTLAYVLFRLGLRRYESGNLVTMRN